MDEDLDIVGVASTENQIALWEPHDQDFEQHVVTSLMNDVRDISTADFNGDGYMDLVVAATSDDEISWWRNYGDFNFRRNIITDNFTQVRCVVALDANNDGNADVLSAGQNGITLWLSEGVSQATASKVQLLSPKNGTTIESFPISLSWEGNDAGKQAQNWSYEVVLGDGENQKTFEAGVSNRIELNKSDLTTLSLEGAVSWHVIARTPEANRKAESKQPYTFIVQDTETATHAELPTVYALHQNYPNPFNPTTTIRYDVKEAGLVSVKIFDLLGREVATLTHEEHSAGVYSVTWDAAGMPSGVYLCRMDAERFVQTRKMVLVK